MAQHPFELSTFIALLVADQSVSPKLEYHMSTHSSDRMCVILHKGLKELHMRGKKKAKRAKARSSSSLFLLNSPCKVSFVRLCEPREPGVKPNNHPIKQWLGGISASQQHNLLLPSLFLGLVSYPTYTHMHTRAPSSYTNINEPDVKCCRGQEP